MRPAESSRDMLILDTKAECKVVLDALEAGALKDVMPTHLGRWDGEAFAHRFREQTRQIDVTSPSVDYEGKPIAQDYIWREKPEFKVKKTDMAIVRTAAQYILDLNNDDLVERAFNRLTGRTRAAKQMLKNI